MIGADRRTSRCFAAFGFAFDVTGPTELVDLVEALYASMVAAREPGHRYEVGVEGDDLVVRLDGDQIARPRVPSLAVEHLIWSVNRNVVQSEQTRLVFHAGGVARDGVGVMLPAGQNHGKSTLTTALVARGWSYLSDEAIAVDSGRQQMIGYPKPISLDPGSHGLLVEHEWRPPGGLDKRWRGSRWHVPPATVGPRAVVHTAPLSLVVLPDYEEGAVPAPERVAGTDAIVRLAQHAFNLRDLGQAGLDHLAGVVRAVPVLSFSHSDLDVACATVEDLARSSMCLPA